MTDALCTPWSLHFDRDGTEDFGIICDADGNDLVASHIPDSKTPPRWKAREFGDGCFWLPEEEGDPVPRLVRQMRLMTAAPKLLEALRTVVGMEYDRDPESRNFDDERLEQFKAIIEEAEDGETATPEPSEVAE
jgi:hypothetical protein